MYQLLVSLLAVTITLAACAAEPLQRIEVQGHRGARGARPENTIPAFQYALDIGVDTLEMDTLVTKDGVVVVTHDPVLNPELCLDKDGRRISSGIPIRSLTLAELKSYDCGSLVNPRFPQQSPVPKTTIPTLDEVFAMAAKHPAGKTVHFNVETKSDENHPEYSPAPEEFVEKLLAIFREHGVLSRVILQSFDYCTLKVAHEKEPGLMLSALLYDRPRQGPVALAKETNAGVFSPYYRWLTATDVADLHAAGVRVIPWTVNDAGDWKRLIDMGIDGIITDNPKELLTSLKR